MQDRSIYKQLLGIIDKESLKKMDDQAFRQKTFFDSVKKITDQANLEKYLNQIRKPRRDELNRWIKYVEHMKGLGDLSESKGSAKVYDILVKHRNQHRMSHLQHALEEGVRIQKSEDELNLGIPEVSQTVAEIHEIMNESVDREELKSFLHALPNETLEHYQQFIEELIKHHSDEEKERKQHEWLVDLNQAILMAMVEDELIETEEEKALAQQQEPLSEKWDAELFFEEEEAARALQASENPVPLEAGEDFVEELLREYELKQHELREAFKLILTDQETLPLSENYLGLLMASVEELRVLHEKSTEGSLSQEELVKQLYVTEQVSSVPAGKEALTLLNRGDKRLLSVVRDTLVLEQHKHFVKGDIAMPAPVPSLTPFQRCALLEFGDSNYTIRLHLDNRVSYLSFMILMKGLEAIAAIQKEPATRLMKDFKKGWGKTGLVTDLTYDVLKAKLIQLRKEMKPKGSAQLMAPSLWGTEKEPVAELMKEISAQQALEKNQHKKQQRLGKKLAQQKVMVSPIHFGFAAQQKPKVVMIRNRNHKPFPKKTG